MAHLSAAAGAAVLRAACMGVEVPGDVTIREREMGGGGGGFGGGGISTAVVDVVSPKARGGQVEEGQGIAGRVRRLPGVDGLVGRIRRRLGMGEIVRRVGRRHFGSNAMVGHRFSHSPLRPVRFWRHRLRISMTAH